MGITKPPTYEHPRKRKRRASKSELPNPARVENSKSPVREKEDDWDSGQARKLSSAPQASTDTIRVRVVAYEPTPGQLKRYDEMIASGIASKVALLGLLRNARAKISDLAKLPSMTISNLDYDHGNEFVETNWSLSGDHANRLKSLFDPFGILTPRALGAKIGTAIIVLADKDQAND